MFLCFASVFFFEYHVRHNCFVIIFVRTVFKSSSHIVSTNSMEMTSIVFFLPVLNTAANMTVFSKGTISELAIGWGVFSLGMVSTVLAV